MQYTNQRIPYEEIQNPYVHSINPSKPNQYGDYTPYNYHNSNMQSPKRFSKDGPTQTLNLNDNVSFARNFKSRLYNVDPQQQQSKQKVQDKYREELRLQIEEDKRRKAEKKAKQDEEDMKWERKFYDNIKIQAQQRANKKQQPNYFVVRSAKGRRKDLQQSKMSPYSRMNNSLIVQASKTEQIIKKDNLKRTLYAPPLIMKRGGYHNKSSLDNIQNVATETNINPQQNNANANLHSPQPISHRFNPEDSLTQQLVVEQDRISKLLIFQQNILKKLDFFKRQIHQTGNVLKLDEQYEKVKLKLRAKPLNMQKVYSLSPTDGLDDLLNNSEMYKLPLISKTGKIYQGQRQIRKQEKKNKREEPSHEQVPIKNEKQIIHLEDRPIHPTRPNDKNILQFPQSQQNEAPGSIQD